MVEKSQQITKEGEKKKRRKKGIVRKTKYIKRVNELTLSTLFSL